MYDFQWHLTHGKKTTTSAERVLKLVASFADLTEVLDLGCGDGRWLSICKKMGASLITGVDGPWTDKRQLLIPSEALLIQDLAAPFDLKRRFSLAISLEVAEHVNEKSSQIFVDNLTRHSDVIVFGAAIPFQGGFRHVNEKWQSYWSELFEQRGYKAFDPIRSQVWDDPDVYFWYKQNALVYVRKGNEAAIERVTHYLKQNNVSEMPLNIVHPEKYENIASYQQIAFRSLLRELPKQTVRKIVSAARGSL